MEQVQISRENHATETNAAEAVDAELVDVSEEGFSVRLQRTRFTAEAQEKEDGTALRFDEEQDVEEFSAVFVEQYYERFLPTAWEVLAVELEWDGDGTTADRPIPIPVQDPAGRPRPSPPVPELEIPERERPDRVPTPVREQPYERSLPASRRPYTEGQDTEDSGQAETVLVAPPVHADDRIHRKEDEERVHISVPDVPAQAYSDGKANAADVVQEMFEYTDLDGTVRLVEEYGVTDDFEGELPEAYWVDIDGMDMDRTEYFINGELAEDAINEYELGPGDTITFIESDIFAPGPEGTYCSGTEGTLELADVIQDVDREKVERYTVPSSAVQERGVAPAYSGAA